jgi:hypothetical protein
MSDTIIKLASKLADDTLTAMDKLGEERLFVEVGSVLAAASQSLEEAYLTEVRVRLAERAARKFLTERLRKGLAAAAAAQEKSGT